MQKEKGKCRASRASFNVVSENLVELSIKGTFILVTEPSGSGTKTKVLLCSAARTARGIV